MRSTSDLKKFIETSIKELQLSGNPAELYDPIRYMIDLGGKRIRPVLVLMGTELFGGNPEDVVSPALGIEVFHNFTLLHDDIMDKAPLRRNMETVHKKWNSDIAILSGDTMFVFSCQQMMKVKDQHLRSVLEVFHKTAIEVCEGQQLDMNFETMSDVSIDDYIHMISLKTAVLLGCSLSIGAICANALPEDVQRIYDFGKNLGIAFQLHDDILDVYGDADKFGKQVGGDIISNKKTFLLLSAMKTATGILKNELTEWINKKDFNPAVKVEAVKTIFNSLQVRESAEKEMDKYYEAALANLSSIRVEGDRKAPLISLAENLMVRES